MYTKWLPTLVLGVSTGIIGCGSSTPENPNSGGSGGSKVATGGGGSGGSAAGSSAGGSLTGGSSSGGSSSGGTESGGTSSGGTSSGGTSSGGMASGGKASGGTSGGAAAGGSSGSGGGGAISGKGAPVPSKGCSATGGKDTLLMGGMSVQKGPATSTRLHIKIGGADREYIIDIPADYNPTHPYRLIFSWHQAYGSDTGNAIGQYPANPGMNFDAEHYAYFGLRRESMTAKDPTIFVAPGGIGDFPWDYTRDVALFDDLLALVDANLCIDDSRVFTTGFSFGAMMSYALSITRQTKLRGAVTMAAANYNLPNGPTTDANAAQVAYMGTTGMSDTRCPWGTDTMGGKACALQHAKDNGCTIPASIPTTKAGSNTYVCYDFEGCKPGYPVKACTFDGNHTPSAIDDGHSNGDDGLTSFIPTQSWKFISQF